MSRDSFEVVLGAMALAGLVRLSDAVFEKDGKQIPYRRVNLTRFVHSVDEQTPIEFVMKVVMSMSAKRKGKKRTVAAAKRKRQRKMEKGSRQNPRQRPFTPNRIPESKGLCADSACPKLDGAG